MLRADSAEISVNRHAVHSTDRPANAWVFSMPERAAPALVVKVSLEKPLYRALSAVDMAEGIHVGVVVIGKEAHIFVGADTRSRTPGLVHFLVVVVDQGVALVALATQQTRLSGAVWLLSSGGSHPNAKRSEIGHGG